MTKNINELEKERIEKIKNLDLDEVKSYIKSLNKKIFQALDEGNIDEIDYLNGKLSEIYEVTKGKYINLEFFSAVNKLDIASAKMIENNTKKASIYVTLQNVVLINASISLRELESILDYLLMIYYHNYYFMETSIIEDLLIKLEFEYDFKDESFCRYANSRGRKYNETLIREMNFLIGMIKDTIIRTIELADMHITEDYEKEAIRTMKEIETEKAYVIQKSDEHEGVKTIKEGEYLDLLDGLKETCEMSIECHESYISIKDRLLEFINSEDGFADLKEAEYEIANKNVGGVYSDKENYIAMRPSYDMKNCEFVESDYIKGLGDDE
jgi:hypothetical protein